MNSRRLGSVVFVLGALGCGAGTIGVDGTDAADETGSGDGDGDPGDGDPGDGDPGDGDGDPAVDACMDDGQLARALAIVDSTAARVHVFEPGGAELILPVPLPEGIDAPPLIQAVTSPGFIAVATSWSIYLGPGVMEEGSVLRLFDRHSGAELWEREFVDRRLGQLFVDGQGRVVATMGWSITGPPVGVLLVDGELTSLYGFAPAGPLGADDWMSGWIIDDSGEYVGAGLYQPFADQLIEVIDSWGASWRAGDQSIEYLDDAAEVPALVIARPDGEQRIELSPFAGLDGTVVQLGIADDHRLFSLTPDEDGPPILVRLQVSTESLLEIDFTPPPGLEPFDCYFSRTTVDAAGRILVELRDAGAAQIHAWDPETAEWTALGVPMTSVDDIGIDGRFGRVELIQAHGAGMTYCMPAEWSEPPASAIPGNSIQLARVDPPLSLVIDAEPFTMVNVDGAERCATWTDASGQVVRDLDDGDALTLGVSGVTLWLD